MVSIIRKNDDIMYYGYDDANRLTAETWKDSGGGSVYAFAWGYDNVGNRTYQSHGTEKTYYTCDAGKSACSLARTHGCHLAERGEGLDLMEPLSEFRGRSGGA